MTYPAFFDEVESILLYDPLADFLGAIESGVTEINYVDVVKLAGHSCPTVAGAYLMAKVGLERIYIDAMPIRGEMKVYVKGAKSEGVNGVIANVISYICGVGDEGGFKGIGGKYSRANKLFFNADIPKEIRIERTDTGQKVDLSYHPEVVPPNPRVNELMQKLLTQRATIDERKEFQRLWQERVAKILLSKELWNELVEVG